MLATLTSLRIRNLALVEELVWNLGPGFTAVTGETGSGKSIILGALTLVLGERAEKALIRTGAESCTVEAVFNAGDAAPLNALLEEQGIEPCEADELILKRAFSAGGGNRQFINGSPTTLAVLKKLGDGLVDLHGPHDHQSLLSEAKQLDLLDAFHGADGLRATYQEHFRDLQRLTTEHDELSTSEAVVEREIDLLRHQVREIESAQLRLGEEEQLLARYSVAANSRKLLELATNALARLAEAEDAVLPRLTEIGKGLREIERIDPAAASFNESHVRAVAEFEELARSLQHYAGEMDLDPERWAQMEERVSLFETLKRKYGGTIGEVIEFGEKAGERLRRIESRGEELVRLKKAIEAARRALLDSGARLGARRSEAAPKLASAVTGHLRDLGFKQSEFCVLLAPLEKPAPHGLEGASFLFSPNLGEPPKPLKAIASSGEISRVMLAVKSALATQDAIGVLVFDEIDANVGGEIAHAVASKMHSLSRERQILCISHLPQVAAAADAQFIVTKEYADGRTLSELHRVEGKTRIEEIARMLGGKTNSALAHARTLLGSHGKQA